jgi:hypothetical protein
MRPAWAAIWGLLALMIWLVRDAITDMCQQEVRTRLNQLPEAVLRVAVWCLPREWREDLEDEWLSELEAIRRETHDVPITSLVRVLYFAVGLLVRGRAVARELTGKPGPLASARMLLRRLNIGQIARGTLRSGTPVTVKGFASGTLRTSNSGVLSISRPAAAMVVATAAALAGAGTIYALRSGSPGIDQALGKWQHIGTRAEDPQPLTLSELYPAQLALSSSSSIRTAASAITNCSQAVFGSRLQAALQSGQCTQVLRASYMSGDGTMMGTVGVVNLNTSGQAWQAGVISGPLDIISPLSSKMGATSKLGNGTGVVQAEIKGHYLILMWAEFVNLKAPSTSAQEHQLEQFATSLVTGSANIGLSIRMLTGKP